MFYLCFIVPDWRRLTSGKTQDRFAFRDQQLLFRRLEIYLAYTAFKQLVTTTYDTSLGNYKLETRFP